MVSLGTRSRLAHLPPCGIGSVEVECLTSYVGRLADVHCVEVGALVRCELEDLLKRAPHRGHCPAGLEQYAADSIAALNGVGAAAQAWGEALAQVTLRSDLGRLTLFSWAAVLPPKGLLRRFRAWCPSCLNAWWQEGLPIYEPLLWTVASVGVCLHHQRPLVERCPNPACGRAVPWLSARARPGCCGRCGQWLGADTPFPLSPGQPEGASACNAPTVAIATADTLQAQCVRARLVGEVLVAPPGHDANALREQVRAAVDYAAQRLCGGNGAALGRLLGVPKNTVWEWRAGAARPQLSLLLRLALLLRVSLRQLVEGPLPSGDERPEPGDELASQGSEKRVWRMNSPEHGRHAATRAWEPVRRALCNELAASAERTTRAPQRASASLQEVAVRLGVPARTLYRRFPDLARAIAAARQADRKARGTQRLTQRCGEVTWAVRRIRARGQPVTSRRFRQVYAKAGYLRDPVVRDAFRAAVRQPR